MKFSKSDFNFMEVFSSCIDTKREMNDKFQIKVKSDGTVIFTQDCDDVKMFRSFKSSVTGEDFVAVFQTAKFYSLIKSIKEGTDITVSSSGIEFNGNKYDLQNFSNVHYDDSEKLIEKYSESSNSDFLIKDLSKLASVKSYMGASPLDCIGVQNKSYFVSSNQIDVTSMVKTDNSLVDDMYLGYKAINMFSNFKVNEIILSPKEGAFSFNLKDTLVVVFNKDYSLPNLFENSIRCLYEHTTKAVIQKDLLKEVLYRIRIVSSENKDNRIFLNFEEDGLKIESKDTIYASEKVVGSVDKDLVGHYLSVSSNYLSNIVSELSGKEVHLYASNDKEAVVITIEDENKDKKYLQNILAYVD
ncbi:MAG: DNA polymerase III subunit beta [bacterium ADurb.Bin363]|nr:MAG: DNA polymerase III subunit beta [bacterium ADurb.Bin363]